MANRYGKHSRAGNSPVRLCFCQQLQLLLSHVYGCIIAQSQKPSALKASLLELGFAKLLIALSSGYTDAAEPLFR